MLAGHVAAPIGSESMRIQSHHSDVPRDARLLAIEHNVWTGEVDLLLEHSSFPDVDAALQPTGVLAGSWIGYSSRDPKTFMRLGEVASGEEGSQCSQGPK